MMSRSRAFVAVIAGFLSLAGPIRADDAANGSTPAAQANGSTPAAQAKGSPAAARAMLERAVAAVKASKAKALADFSAGADGFRDHDLYVFCARTDGTVDAHIDPAQIGRNIKDIYDINGVAFGQEMLAIARAGEIKAVSYMWPEPASHTPVPKVTFFTREADQVCGVGYYK